MLYEAETKTVKITAVITDNTPCKDRLRQGGVIRFGFSPISLALRIYEAETKTVKIAAVVTDNTPCKDRLRWGVLSVLAFHRSHWRSV